MLTSLLHSTLLLLTTPLTLSSSQPDSRPWTAGEKLAMREEVRDMISHTYTGYMAHAFPHDELKPLTGSYTDSWVELGDAKRPSSSYRGVALTLIDSLDTLAMVGNVSEFAKQVRSFHSRCPPTVSTDRFIARGNSRSRGNGPPTETVTTGAMGQQDRFLRLERRGLAFRDQHPAAGRPTLGAPAGERRH